jgi:hypothetical protein
MILKKSIAAILASKFNERECEIENGAPIQKHLNLRKRDRSFVTARNRHKRMKYSDTENLNDQIYFGKCQELVRISKEMF